MSQSRAPRASCGGADRESYDADQCASALNTRSRCHSVAAARDASDEKPDPGVQRLPVGGTDAHRRTQRCASAAACSARSTTRWNRPLDTSATLNTTRHTPSSRVKASVRRGDGDGQLRSRAAPPPLNLVRPAFPRRTRLGVFFDIDGTRRGSGSDTVRRAARARSARLNRDLHHASGGALALISGRSIESVDSIFGSPRLRCGGHVRATQRGGPYQRTMQLRQAGARRRERLVATVSRHPRITLEDKGISLALHTGRPGSRIICAQNHARHVIPEWGLKYAILTGKRIIELKPSGKDKEKQCGNTWRKSPSAAHFRSSSVTT